MTFHAERLDTSVTQAGCSLKVTQQSSHIVLMVYAEEGAWHLISKSEAWVGLSPYRKRIYESVHKLANLISSNPKVL